MTRRAVVIGGGINGLVAAAILARRGQQVSLYEQAGHLGGMAGGPGAAPRLAHLLHNLSPLVRQDIGLGRRGWSFKTVTLPTVLLTEGRSPVIVERGVATDVDGTPHPDAKAFQQLVTELQSYGALLKRLAEAPPPGGDMPWHSMAGLRRALRLGGFGLALRRMGKPEMRRFLQILLSNAADMVLDRLPDGPLAGMLAADAVRGLATGPRAPGTVFSLIYRYGHGGNVHLPIGGMRRVIDTVADAARQAGATLYTGMAVEGITFDRDKITGVVTADGNTFEAATVLTSTGPMAAAKLVGLDAFDIEATRRFRSIRARGTTAKINLTLGALPALPDLPDQYLGARWVIAPSIDAVERAFNPSKYGAMSSKPNIEAILPGITDPLQDADGKPTLSIIAQFAPSDLAGGWTDAARDTLLSHVLTTLDGVAPRLSGLVEAAEVISPDRIEAETGAPGGHWHHAELSLDQTLSVRPANGIGHYAMGPEGLYLCGASTHPGGDVMGLSGRNAALAALEALS